ncbi:ABC transporter ATP-binding protein [Georgenia sp. EYE_87]|uniref:ABC transporter ATP-binding protein n=1 Tax=Georgenia sp. EYE_87 TaxID=2853448 RepID=UPI002005E1FE|nr:ABC transporter ATP-binding protein [Georgenia sp. EYE_87]MCK6210792.1 ABC transporter ATP-binding protein [Georgenia sp. EYE_87]
MVSSGISAHGVEMRYGRGAGPLILENLDIEIAAGSFVTLLGPSGCGKSTLLKILGGILEPTAGSVQIGDTEAGAAVKNRQIGLVPQRPALLPWKTALQNAAMLREIAGGGRGRQVQVAAEDALRLVGLDHAKGKLPHELSGGMAQRVSIARALAMDPAILLMDEPFGALDAITRDEMNEKLAEIWASTRKTVVFVTHSISEAIFLSDVVHVMGVNPGRVVETVEIELSRPRTRDVFDAPLFAEYSSHLRDRLEPRVAA